MERVNNLESQKLSPLTLFLLRVMALIDSTLSNARQVYSSMGNPFGWKGLKVSIKLRINTFITIWGFDAQCFLEEQRFYTVKSKAEFLRVHLLRKSKDGLWN